MSPFSSVDVRMLLVNFEPFESVCVDRVLFVPAGEKNEMHFLVATQDEELRSQLRQIPGQFALPVLTP